MTVASNLFMVAAVLLLSYNCIQCQQVNVSSLIIDLGDELSERLDRLENELLGALSDIMAQQLDSALEGVRDKLDALSMGQQSLSECLNKTKERLGNIEHIQFLILDKLIDIMHTLKHIETNQESTNGGITELKSHIAELKAGQQTNRDCLSTMKAQLGDITGKQAAANKCLGTIKERLIGVQQGQTIMSKCLFDVKREFWKLLGMPHIEVATTNPPLTELPATVQPSRVPTDPPRASPTPDDY